MILIADSGGSKTDWRLLKSDGSILQHRGQGFNPYYQTSEEMRLAMQEEFLVAISGQVDHLYFYGAGCSSSDRVEEVRQALETIFPKAEIYVDHDLAAAAHATCGHEKGIACILGTGSNSCDYDGKAIIDSRPAPGFILGDEGGGAFVGRKLLRDFIYTEMPSDIREAFQERFQLTQESIQEHVYRKPFPSRYLASFCRFITEHTDHPYCYHLFYDSFLEFFEKHVCRYEDFQKKPVSFVGSIAYYNGSILRKAGMDRGLTIRLIIESPIAGLTLYHQSLL